MKASSNNLLSIIKGPRQFVIPIYQRTYSWQLVQCNQLLNDILRISTILPSRGTLSVLSFIFRRAYIQCPMCLNFWLLMDSSA